MSKDNSQISIDWLQELNDWDFDNIVEVCFHYEDCEECPSNETCQTMDKMILNLALVKTLIEEFEGLGIAVEKHANTSETNAKHLLKSPNPDRPLPLELNVVIKDDEPVFCVIPHYNYFTIKYKNGEERMLTINLEIDEYEDNNITKGSEGVSCPMYS